MSGWTYPLHSAVHPAVGAVLMALGENPGTYSGYFTPASDFRVSERGIISIPGRLKDVIFDRRVIPAGAAPGSREEAGEFHFITVRPGDVLQFPRNNVEKCGNIICRESTGPEAATSAQLAEAGVTAYLFRLQPVSFRELQSILRSDFPPAYPELLKTFLHEYDSGNRKSQLHRPAEQLPGKWKFNIPAPYLNYEGKDWNYRSILNSLQDSARIIPDFRWEAGGDASRNPEMLFVLLRAGYQGLCYYLDAENSQNQGDSTDISIDEAIRKIIQEFKDSPRG